MVYEYNESLENHNTSGITEETLLAFISNVKSIVSMSVAVVNSPLIFPHIQRPKS